MPDPISVVVCRARREDLATLVAGNTAMARETEGLTLDPATLQAGVSAVLTQDVDGHYYVAEVDGQEAGQLMITREWSDWRCAWVWWIQSVYVWPAFRRHGVYRALYEQVLHDAHEAGAGGIRLYVDSRNTRAQQVYSRLGMNGEHYRVFERVPLDPAAELELELQLELELELESEPEPGTSR